jgi:hypothetical protein
MLRPDPVRPGRAPLSGMATSESRGEISTSKCETRGPIEESCLGIRNLMSTIGADLASHIWRERSVTAGFWRSDHFTI